MRLWLGFFLQNSRRRHPRRSLGRTLDGDGEQKDLDERHDLQSGEVSEDSLQ